MSETQEKWWERTALPPRLPRKVVDALIQLQRACQDSEYMGLWGVTIMQQKVGVAEMYADGARFYCPTGKYDFDTGNGRVWVTLSEESP